MFGVEDEVIEEVEARPEGAFPRSALHTPDLDLLVERLEQPERRIWIDRAILISLLVHVLILLALVLKPPAVPVPEDEIFQEGLRLKELHDQSPMKFFVESPGPARPTTRAGAPPSDATRQASGGDRSRPKSDTPYVARQAGIEGLAPGERTNRGAQASPERSAAAASPPSSPAPPASEATASPEGTGAGPAPRPPASGRTLPDLNRAIRSATGGSLPGQGGSPRANEQGGFVDSGPISFDTQWYDWSDYAEEMIRRIKLHWEIPELARMGARGKLSIRFYIRADGTVEGEQIIRTSDIPPFDHSSFQAIATSSPFRPLPKELHEEREGVTITFFYNIPPESGR